MSERMTGSYDIELINPPYRMEIKTSLPRVILFDPAIESREKTDLGEKLKTSCNEVFKKQQKIIVAYPQKNPEIFKDHDNDNHRFFYILEKVIEERYPRVNIKYADNIYENIHLNRSTNRGIIHSLTGKQLYTINENSDTPLTNKKPFEGKSFFIFDHCIDIGATIANMYSFIEYNGGKVLKVFTMKCFNYTSDGPIKNYSILQQKPSRDEYMPQEFDLDGVPETFLEKGKNNKRVPHLATVFKISSAKEGAYLSPGKCMIEFEKALNMHGNSVFALTNHECAKITHALTDTIPLYFSEFIDLLNKKNPHPMAKTPPYSPLAKI